MALIRPIPVSGSGYTTATKHSSQYATGTQRSISCTIGDIITITESSTGGTSDTISLTSITGATTLESSVGTVNSLYALNATSNTITYTITTSGSSGYVTERYIIVEK